VSQLHRRLTFCCLHSLQALRLPPRRLPVTGGVFSISPDSGLRWRNSPAAGRDSRGDRKSLEKRGGPFGASRFRYSRSIRIVFPRYKNPNLHKRCVVMDLPPEIGASDRGYSCLWRRFEETARCSLDTARLRGDESRRLENHVAS